MTTRDCTACGTPNEADARFCEGCGTALERTCGACGVAVSATARFCKGCGSPLGGERSPAAEGPTRKIVTVLFADLAGSTAFEEIVDAETAREVIGRYHELLRSTVERHRVGVTKYIGDGFMAVWGVPEIGADDAGRAVDAAVELQEHFVGLARQVAEAHGVELALRVAVNTGEVVVGADDADLVGDALNVGARLESECPHGQVVVGEETWRSTRGRLSYEPLGAVQVKGRQAPVSVYRWLGQRSDAAEAISFVGRGDELQRLRRVFDNAVTARAARLVTVTGDPGVGKTRLAAEFVGTLPGARVIDVRCAVEGSPALAPVVEVLRPLDLEAEIPAVTTERDRMLRDLTGMTAGVPGSVEETFWALRRLVEVLASRSPVVVVFDDIQWADSLLLDFIEHVAEWVRGAPVLMLALARPELRETRPDLVTVGGWVTEAVRLRGLEADATAELAGHVLGSDRLPEELLRRLPTSTGGNPLFVRELVGMLVHDGVLAAKPGGWRLTVDADDIDVPPTIQALLASRLERLKPADRRVLEVASVIGTDFTGSGVTELSGLRSTEITAALDRLRRLDLAQPSGTYAGDEAVWRFHHVLIRDVAYRRLLKSERADLHERLANWVEAGGTNLAFESDEVVARNLEAAQGYRADLGLRDAHGAELALRSARSYLSSARRALDRDELVSAGTQAARGAVLAVADTALHAELLLVGCEAFLSAGDVAAGSPLVDELERIAGEALAPWAICYRCQLVVYTDPSRLPEADKRLQEAIDEFARRGDAAGLAKAHRVRANARARLGRVGDAEIDLFEALIAARRGGDHRQITAALGAAPNAALWGPSPAPKAGGRCLDVVRMQRMTTAAPSLEATSLRCLAVLELLRGRPDKARTMLADARQVVAELGLRHGLMETELYAGIIELMVGDPVAAEPHFRTALEGLDALGVGADAGQAAALLARSILAQGRLEEADRYAAESERIAGHNLKTAIGWRAVRAEILSAQGRHEAAVAKAREAVAVAADTDLVLDHADACLALSRVLDAAGDASGAARARTDAESLYAAKDAVFMVSRTAETVSAPATPVSARVTTGSRLVVRNRASDLAEAGWRALQNHDIEAVVAAYSHQPVYDDRRVIGGGPLAGAEWVPRIAERAIADYPHAEWQILAVRGDSLALLRGRLWDDAGNESVTLNVHELAADGLIGYHGRFDGDDFESAYREMEARYFAGEGAEFAETGRAARAWQTAIAHRDREVARRVSWPDFHWLASPSSLKPEVRTLDQFFDWIGGREEVASMQAWGATVRWLSRNCWIGLTEMRGAGAEGDGYLWQWIHVGEHHGGRASSVREFDLDDEDAAFAYAESLVAQKQRRLVVANAASRAVDQALEGLQAKDSAAVDALFSPEIVYEDRRPFSGALTTGIEYVSGTIPALLAQYDDFTGHAIAVRGDRICLATSRWSDDTGNASSNLHVIELGDDGLITRYLYCDGEDFAGAYREMEAWYYAGEGATYAEHGRKQAAFVQAMNHLDALAAHQLCRPEFRWSSPTRALAEPVRTIDEVVSWWRDRAKQVDSLRNWTSAIIWMSPEVAVSVGEARGISADGADYSWSGIFVASFRDGLLESVNGFEPEDEDDAFAFAQSLVKQRNSRLVVANAASRARDQAFAAFQRNDPSAVASLFSAEVVYEDRRPIAGALQTGVDYLNEVIPALLSQYQHFETRTVAVRGDRLCLAWSRFSDEDGNEATNLHITELGEGRLIARLVYFVEEDFWSAYREMEARYFDGEGAPYARGGGAAVDWVTAISNGDLEGVRSVSHPDFRWYATPTALKEAERTVDDMFRWWQERGRQVSSQRHWVPAVQWLSPDCAVGLGEVEAVGPDGEKYNWSFIHVCECRDGLVLAVREFDDEDSAFVYAESVVAPKTSRLSLMNAPSRVANRIVAALRAGDLSTVVETYAENLGHGDHRRLSGDPVTDRAGLRSAWERIAQMYCNFEIEVLAVRGERLHLARYRWSDDAGNQSIGLALSETGDDGRIVFQDRFDDEDFESAYAELERRYYSGEGAPNADEGAAIIEMVVAENRGDLDGAFSVFLRPGLQIENRSRSVFPTRTAAELRRSVEALGAMVTSYRVWSPAYCWLSPNWVVAHHEREAVGDNGETYRWSRLYAGEIRGGLFTSLCEFDADDEDAAFAYAEEQMRTVTSRLTLNNRASEVGFDVIRAARTRDIDAAVAAYSGQVVYEDRRHLGGDPIIGSAGVRAAIIRLCGQYNGFQMQTLAVRGDRLHLAKHIWSDNAGNESHGLTLVEVDEEGRAIYHGSFDEDDFIVAFVELEERYYSGEGAAFAESGKTASEVMVAGNKVDLDKLFGELAVPGLRVESRSGTIFPDRTTGELRDSVELFHAMVSSSQTWYSAVEWLTPQCVVTRQERRAVGKDGERYEWSRIYVAEFDHGLFTAICDFDADFEEEAFAYAEQRVRDTASRLAVTNRASRVADSVVRAFEANDVDGVLGCYSDDFVFEDRRQLSGALLRGKAALRTDVELFLRQFDDFGWQTIAVRGETLALCRNRWSDSSGNESRSLQLVETNHEGLTVYVSRFDEDDFEGTYRELEARYYAGEGAAFAEYGRFNTDYLATMNRGDFDAMFNELTSPEFHFENRGHSIFPNRSARELRASFEDLYARLASVRAWFSALRWVSPTVHAARFEREGVGHDGEQYAWTRVLVNTYRDGRLASICEFDPGDEAAALAYAEELARQT